MFRIALLLFAFIMMNSSWLGGQNAIDASDLDSIVVKVDGNKEAFYWHTLRKGETVYSLARFFQVNHNDLLILNDLTVDQILPLGIQIKIPIQTDHIFSGIHPPSQTAIPIYYSVRRKETLFKISQVYFNQSIESLIARNSINKLSLNIGQTLLIGWWPREKENLISSPPIFHDTNINRDTVLSHNNNLQTKASSSDSLDYNLSDSLNSYVPESIVIDIKSQQGIAIWERNDPDDTSLLVLHRSAQIGSVIKLQNPVNKLIAVAQVVGHIPDNLYSDDIDLIISKGVALKLGALDTRFQILMTFYE